MICDQKPLHTSCFRPWVFVSPCLSLPTKLSSLLTGLQVIKSTYLCSLASDFLTAPSWLWISRNSLSCFKYFELATALPCLEFWRLCPKMYRPLALRLPAFGRHEFLSVLVVEVVTWGNRSSSFGVKGAFLGLIGIEIGGCRSSFILSLTSAFKRTCCWMGFRLKLSCSRLSPLSSFDSTHRMLFRWGQLCKNDASCLCLAAEMTAWSVASWLSGECSIDHCISFNMVSLVSIYCLEIFFEINLPSEAYVDWFWWYCRSERYAEFEYGLLLRCRSTEQWGQCLKDCLCDCFLCLLHRSFGSIICMLVLGYWLRNLSHLWPCFYCKCSKNCFSRKYL